MTLLDTHALLWLAFEPKQLSKKATERIRQESAKGELAIAAVTCWELALLCARRRIAFTGTIASYVAKLASRTTILPLTPEIAATGAELGRGFPRDPADRLITATALVHGIAVITKDVLIRRSGAVTTIW
jgi:PIN domain nuclease of toxin-antitoxin system